MNPLSLSTRTLLLSGIVQLLCTCVGAGWILQPRALGTGPVALSALSGPGIIGTGFVDVEDGIAYLHPPLPGVVDQVYIGESDKVKEGDLLLSLDNRMQRIALRQAQADLEAAGITLAAAQRKMEKDLPAKHESDIQVEIDLARCNVKAKEAQRDLAHLAVVQCDLYAPADGVVLRLFATRGDLLSGQGRHYAVHFCPNTRRVIRAEILQEWAGKVKKGQVAFIEDDTRHGPQWKGKVVRVSDQFTQRRSTLQEPFQYNDVRTLECIVSLDDRNTPLVYGQRVRVIINQGRKSEQK